MRQGHDISRRLRAPKAGGAATARPDPAQRWLGTRLGAYRLSRLLGQGVMGHVFLAERADGQLQRAVALKLGG